MWGSFLQFKLKTSNFKLFTLSLILVFVFTNTGIAETVPVMIPVPNDAKVMEFVDISEIEIPSEMGSIEQMHFSRALKSTAASEAVILIQDAHGIPDAQKNIQKIIQYLNQTHGLQLIGVEGVQADLDPQFFRSFPDQEKLKATLKLYYESGELTGTSAAAILLEEKTRFFGLEDWKLYEEGLDYYQQAVSGQENLRGKLKAERLKLNALKDKTYSEELRNLDRLLEAFHQDETGLIDTLQELAIIQRPQPESELTVLLDEFKEINHFEIEKEVRDVAEAIKQSFVIPESRYRESSKGTSRSPMKAFEDDKEDSFPENKRTRFNTRYQEFNTGRITPQAFALFLKEFAEKKSLSIHLSERLSLSIKNEKRLRDIQGTRVFSELGEYVESIKESLFRNEDERRLYQQSHKLDLIAKLVNLELTSDEWEEFKEFKVEDLRFQEQTNKAFFNLDAHRAFYENAQKRDEIFFEKTIRVMREEKQRSSLLVTGGFHTQSLVKRLKDENINYVVISPQIASIPEDIYYLDQMHGRVSWQGSFKVKNGKVNLYDAFVRHTRDQLLASKDSLHQVADPRSQVLDPMILKAMARSTYSRSCSPRRYRKSR